MNMFLQTRICSSLEDKVFKWDNIMIVKIILTSLDGRGIVNAICPVSATKLLSVCAGIAERELMMMRKRRRR